MIDSLGAMPDAEPVGGAMTDEELAAHLDDHEMRAVGYFEGEIASAQARALDRYYRRPYGNERDGRSKATDGTVAITVDNALAAIIKPFVSSDETVVFEPRGEEDEDQAQQATEYVNYVLHQDNCGFLILHDWFKDALLQKLGVVKASWEDATQEKVKRLEGLDPMQVEKIMAEEQVADGPFGPDESGLFVIDVLHSEPEGKLVVENIPPEEYRISPFARPGRTPPYEAQITNKPRSDLIELGFDPDVVDGLSKSTNVLEDTRSQSRYGDEDFGQSQLEPPGDKSREMVQVNDEYVLIDYDGDGISELRRVIRCGNTILFNEEVEEGPFATLCPVPMPHKIYGLSLADQVMEEEEIATVLLRQTLDNLYLANNPRAVVPEGAERSDGSTIDDLLSPAPGAPIRTAAAELGTFSIPFVGDKSFPMLEYIAAQAEARTGISKHGQGMSPDAIDKSGQISATQAALMDDGRNARSEMIARIFAETGIKKLFKLMLRLLVAHQPRARMIRLRNKWVEMDPRQWNADMDLAIAVGLGMGSKAEQMTTAEAVLQLMERLGMTPFASLIDKEKVYNATKRFYNAAGIKNVDDYLVEPQKDEQGNLIPEEPQPDPEQMKLQAEMQMQSAKMEGEQQLAQIRLQSDQMIQAAKIDAMREEAVLRAELARDEATASAILSREKAEAELELAQQKFAAEVAMEERRMEMEDRRAERDANRRDVETDAKISQNRKGGDLDK